MLKLKGYDSGSLFESSFSSTMADTDVDAGEKNAATVDSDAVTSEYCHPSTSGDESVVVEGKGGFCFSLVSRFPGLA